MADSDRAEKIPKIGYILFKDEEDTLLKDQRVTLKNRCSPFVKAGEIIQLNGKRKYLAKVEKKVRYKKPVHFDLEVELIKEIEPQN